MIWFAEIIVPMLLFSAAQSASDIKSVQLFSETNWRVERVTFEDGEVSCVAEVTNHDKSESLSLWKFEDRYQLQFYSEKWSFGEGRVADVSLKIDDNGVWNMTNAELYLNSVLFKLPADANGNNFMAELKNGKLAVLTSGGDVGYRNYSLLGAAGAVPYLENCFR